MEQEADSDGEAVGGGSGRFRGESHGGDENKSRRHGNVMAGMHPADRFVMFLDKVVGKGRYGVVCKGMDAVEKELVAVKCLRRGPFLAKPWVKREILNQKMLQHPHIVCIKGVFLKAGHLCIAMELCDGGNLLDLMNAQGCIQEDWARWYFQQLILALDFCHKKGVAVRDVKLEHLLLSKDKMYLKLCDFGWSKHSEDSAPHTVVGSRRYLPPELVMMSRVHKEEYDAEKVDVWCCGVCLYTMLYGCYPTLNMRMDLRLLGREEILQNIRKGMKNPTRQTHHGIRHEISEQLNDLLDRLLEPDCNERINIQGIFNHPWFQHGFPEEAKKLNGRLLRQNERDIRLGRRLQSDSEIEELILTAQGVGST